jgi:hypothetical protein
MNCSSAMEKIPECARRRMESESTLAAHLKTCQACGEFWEQERNLTAHMRMIRIASAGRRSSAGSRDALMRQFAEKHRAASNGRWLWSLAAAAAVLLALILIQGAERKSRPVVASQPAGAAAQAEVQTDADVSEDGDGQYDGFIPVPYVPPLAAGELVSVVHTELYPLELARLGVSVDPSWATELPADLLVGEDGFPRAVRVSDEYSEERGF